MNTQTTFIKISNFIYHNFGNITMVCFERDNRQMIELQGKVDSLLVDKNLFVDYLTSCKK